MTDAAIRPGAGDRLLAATAPLGRVSRTMGLVAGASLLGHLAVVGTIAVTGRAAVVPPTEIAVEIVHEVPKPAPEPTKPSAKPEAAKPKTAKAEAAKAEPAKPELNKPEPTKPEPAKREIAKVARAKPQARPAPAKPERKVAAAQPAPPPEKDAAADQRKLAALQQELDSLKAEQAQLRAERAAEGAQSALQKVALRDTGFGLLPGSFQAIALPTTTDGAGEAASYEAIVFSALAKAKDIGHRQGVPGTAGVRFSVDPGGKLVAVELIHWSGIPDLDAEALALVRRAVFPPPPQGAQRTFVANVNFEADRRR